MNANAQAPVKMIARRAKLSSQLKDITPGECELLGYKDKPETGVWCRIKLHTGDVVTISTGEMAALHNDKVASIFNDESIEEGAVATFRADLKMGIRGGEVVFN